MTLVYIDMETTGLDERVHEIAMIGAAVDDPWREFEVLVRFDEAKADPAAPREWYDRARWEKESVPIGEALASFDAWLEGVAGSANLWPLKLCGHFAAEFDKRFLLAAYAATGRKYRCDFRARDTLQLAMWLYPHRKSYKLGDLYLDLCGGTIDKRGGAINDVRATAAIVKAMRSKNLSERKASNDADEKAEAEPSEALLRRVARLESELRVAREILRGDSGEEHPLIVASIEEALR